MNLGDPEILALAESFAYSVQVALDPKSTPADRFNANRAVENFRTAAPPLQLCSVGFILSSSSASELVLTGFQLIEAVATYHWNQFEQRNEVKEKLCEQLKAVVQNPVFATNYVQEALARVVVEIAKKEWPQLWPNLWPELCLMAEVSDVPLLVLRRLVEDIVTLQRIDRAERRHELSQALNAIAQEIMSLMFKIILDSLQGIDGPKGEGFKKRGKVALGTLLPYVEWVNPSWFMVDTRIPILFALLKRNEFKMEAASCIIQLVERKPVKKESKYEIPVATLSDECMNSLTESIRSCQLGDIDYLKKVGGILSSLGSNLPSNRGGAENLVKCISELASRPETDAVSFSASAYNQYLRTINKFQDRADSNPAIGLNHMLGIIVQKCLQEPNPSEKEEMGNIRSQLSQILRVSAKADSKLYQSVSQLLNTYVNSQAPVPTYQWEFITFMIEAVASNILPEESEMIKVGLRDLESVHARFDREIDLDLKSTILSTVSSLFVFLSLSKQRSEFEEGHMKLFVAIIESLFNCFYMMEESAKGIRHHVISLFIKLASKNSDVLVMAFEPIRQALVKIDHCLTILEHQGFAETLLVLSNAWNNPKQQAEFIRSLLETSSWQTISAIISSPTSFVQIFEESQFHEKKSLISRYINLLYAVLRRVKVKTPNHADVSILEHPAYECVRPLMPIILQYVKTVHSLLEIKELKFIFDLTPGETGQIVGIANYANNCVPFIKPLPVTNGGSALIMSTPSPDLKDSTHQSKIKSFVLTTLELSYGILGESCTLFMPNFYYMPGISEAYLTFIGSNMKMMKDYRVRNVIRNVYRPFLLSCPIQLTEGVIKPFLQSFAPFVVDRLLERWPEVQIANQSPDGEERQEVIDSSVLRLLTKEYLEVIQRLLERSAANDCAYNGSNEDQMDMDRTEQGGEDGEIISKPSKAKHTNGGFNDLGDVGLIILSDPTCFNAIILLAAHALSWEDSLISFRACRCLLLGWNMISKHVDVIHHVFPSALRNICVWMDNESNLDVLVRIIDLIFRTFHQTDPFILQTIQEWGANEADITNLIQLCVGNKNEKKRKDFIRKLARTNPNLEKNRARKSSWLSGLPKLVIQKDVPKPPTADFDLQTCFSVIHC